MPTLFGNASTWLSTQLEYAAGVTVSYTRSDTTVSITAVVGQTLDVSQANTGTLTEYGERDYLIKATEITSLGEPLIGDRITETLAGSSHVFEVMSPTNGEPAWRWSDAERTVYRVHCKRVT